MTMKDLANLVIETVSETHPEWIEQSIQYAHNCIANWNGDADEFVTIGVFSDDFGDRDAFADFLYDIAEGVSIADGCDLINADFDFFMDTNQYKYSLNHNQVFCPELFNDVNQTGMRYLIGPMLDLSRFDIADILAERLIRTGRL